METVYIGSKDISKYISACFFALGKDEKIKVIARGKNIKRALDVVAILKRDYLENPSYEVVIDSEEFKDSETGDIRKITSVEVELSGIKKEKIKRK